MIIKRLALFAGLIIWSIPNFAWSQQPSIDIRDISLDAVPDGSTTVSATNDTDFGTLSVCGTTIVKQFIIINGGNAPLTLSAPVFNPSGVFSVLGAFPGSIPASTSDTIAVQFSPTSFGTFTSEISIANNAPGNSNPYTFTVQGVFNSPEIEVRGNSQIIADGDVTPATADHTDFGSTGVCSGTVNRIFTINNLGNAQTNINGLSISGAHASDFSILSPPSSPLAATSGTTNFTIVFNPSAEGLRTATISFNNQDCDEGPYNFSIQGTGIEPEIDIRGNAISIPDGDVSTSAADDTDFGAVNACSGTNPNTFTIHNTGTTTLNISAVTSSNNTEFAISGINPPSTIAAGASATFTVTFDPSTFGNRTSTITVTNDDCNEASYDFAVSGTGQAAELDVSRNSNDIPDGSAVVAETNFGNVNSCTGAVGDRTYTIRNTGNSSTTIGTVTGSGDFSIISQPSSPLAAGATTSFTVRFLPSTQGTRTGTISFSNQDCDENPFNFAVQGFGTAPEVNVKDGANSIADGSVPPGSGTAAHFGSQSTCSGTITKVFTIENTGDAPLVINPLPALSGPDATDFTITVMPTSPVAAGGSTTFTVVFDPSANNTRDATITFTSDDCTGSEAVYNFAIRGVGTSPEINLKGGSPLANIADGDALSSTTDGTNFGDVAVCTGTQTKTFTIENTDNNTALSVGAITFSGPDAADFSVTTAPSSSVAGNASTTFVVTFNPSSAGVKNATLNIVNGDCNENPYDFAVSGNGLDPEMTVFGNSIEILNGASVPSINDDTDFGSKLACGGSTDFTYSIENSGNTNLTISSVTVSPTTNFSIVTQPTSPVAPLGSTTFTVRFTPSSVTSGLSTATVTINNSDCDRPAFTFAVQGTTLPENTPPTATCQNFTAYLSSLGTVTVAGSSLNNGSTDNCTPSNSLTFSSGGFYDCRDVGVIQPVAITVTDAFGNSSTCATRVVTVLDTVKPIAICRNVTLHLNAAGTFTMPASNLNNGSTDACGLGPFNASKTTYTCSDVGTSTQTLTVTDVNGNSRTCTSSVTVLDTVRPNAICQNISVALDANGNGTTTATAVDNVSNDACGIQSRSLSLTSFTCANLGPVPVTLTVTDVNGNTKSCSATIQVVDNLPPSAVCRNETIYLNAAGNASILPQVLNNSSTDNCTLGTLLLDVSAFDCSDVGPNVVTLIVPDQSNNRDSCTSTVTVLDTLRPLAVCRDIFIVLDTVNGQATITPSQINNNSFDVCGLGIMSLDTALFDCDDVSQVNPVILTVRDVNNNSDTCRAFVTIVDNSGPSAVCVGDTIFLDALGQCQTSADSLSGGNDPCGGVTALLSQQNFDCSDIGSNLVTVTLSDLNGNTSVCQANVFVRDTIKPVARCVDVVITLNQAGALSINPFFVDDNSFDNCSILSRAIDRTTFSCSDVNLVQTVVLTVSDPSGLQDTCHATVTTRDYTLPTVSCNNQNVTLDANGNGAITLSSVLASVADACGIASVSLNDSTFNCNDVGVNQVILTVLDNAGNIRRCTSQVNVTETVAPNAVCRNIDLYLDSTGTAQITSADIDNGSTDNCSIQQYALSDSLFDCSHVGPVQVSLTVEDEAGNQDICTATITVQDTISPFVVCRDTTINLLTGSSVQLTVNQLLVSSGDNCGIASESMPATVFDCANFGPNNVVITVVDSSGNASSCTSIVTIVGNALSGQAQVVSDFCGFNVSCNGGQDGLAIATASGGCPPHRFDWSNGGRDDTLANVSAGTYIVTITDSRGVTMLDTVVITQPNPLTVTVVGMQQTCLEDTIGALDIDVTGGNLCGGSYLYNWSTGDTTQDISGLSGGIYTLTLTDPLGCQTVEQETVTTFPVPNPVISSLPPPDTTTLTVSPAFFSYQWYWNGDSIVGATSQSYFADTSGQYHVTVVSADGCVGASDSIEVLIVIISAGEGASATYSVVLYPNPNQGSFFLSAPEVIPHPVNVRLTDLQGRVLMSKELPYLGQQHEFEAGRLSSGTYLVHISGAKIKPLTIKMVVQ